jgi:hypothetical protein
MLTLLSRKLLKKQTPSTKITYRLQLTHSNVVTTDHFLNDFPKLLNLDEVGALTLTQTSG